MKEELLVHYYDLPKEMFITLKDEFHINFCKSIQDKLNSEFKNCFYTILNCPKWHAQRLFTRYTRMTLLELEKLREFIGITKEEVEQNIETIGNYEDGTIIKNPKLPYNMQDLVYVASHLIFDGCYRYKKGCYFYSYEEELTKYHLKRLNNFGEIPTNFIKDANQLWFSYSAGYMASKVLEIDDFGSTSVNLSKKLMNLLKENKELLNEFIKAMVIDEGYIEDFIRVELNNKNLIYQSSELINNFYHLNPIKCRTRSIYFKEYNHLYKNTTSWIIVFSSKSIKNLYEEIAPLPIQYKQESFELLLNRQTRNWYKRKSSETKKLIVSSLLNSPKSILELSLETKVRNTPVNFHIKGGHPTFKRSLTDEGIVKIFGDKKLRKGGYAKSTIYGISDKEKAKKYLKI